MSLSISLAEAYGLLSSVQFAISMLFTTKNKSASKILDKRGTITDPWSTPKQFLSMCCMSSLFLLFTFCLINSHELILRQAN